MVIGGFPLIPDGNHEKVYFKVYNQFANVIRVMSKGSYLGKAVLKYHDYNYNRDNHTWENIYNEKEVNDLIKYFTRKGYNVIDGRKNNR